MTDTWTPPEELQPVGDAVHAPNGKRRRRPDPKARLEHERAELKQIDKELAAARQLVADLTDDRRITLAWIATNERLLGEGPARKRTAKKATPDQ